MDHIVCDNCNTPRPLGHQPYGVKQPNGDERKYAFTMCIHQCFGCTSVMNDYFSSVKLRFTKAVALPKGG